MKFAAASTFLVLVGSVTAFTPTSRYNSATNSVKTSTSSVNAGFVDEMPGALDPVGFFDPFGISARAGGTKLRRYREAELTHGRVAMLAVIGFLVQETGFHPLFNTADKELGPAIRHLDAVRENAPFFFEILALGIGAAEVQRALIGWEKPGDAGGWPGVLREEYIPGDIGFDPLNLKPENAEELKTMQTKELQHGRLAMLAISGFVAQELVDGRGIIEHFTS